MKKLLLILSFVSLWNVSAQDQIYWEEYSTGFSTTSTTFSQFSFVDENIVWGSAADGSGGGAVFQLWGKSLDGGLTWTNGNIVLGNSNLGIGSIHAVSATTAYVAAYPNTATVQGGIWVTNDGGATWTKQTTASFNTGTDSFTNFVHFWDANNGVCQGDPASGYFEIYTTTNGGVNWTRVPSANIPAPLSGEYGYVRNFDVVGDTMWFGTNKGRMYKSTNRGLNWTVAVSPISDFGSAAVNGNYSFKDLNNGLLIDNDWNQYRTVDGAATWSTPEAAEGLVRNFDVEFVPGSSNTYVCTGEDILDGFRGSSYSLDGGLSWIDINEFDINAVDGGGALEFFDCDSGLASGFTASSSVGGVWKWIASSDVLCPPLANETFSNDKAFTASPNPTSGLVTIAGKGISNVVITDVLGKQVANTNFTSVESTTIDMSSYNAGIYLVKVTNANGNASTIKVVRQ